MSDSSVIPWPFHRGMTTILIIVSCSETTVTMITIISDDEMMTIVTIARSNETMMTIKTMISIKEMLTISGSSETVMTMIINYEMPIVTIVSSSMAFAYMKTMISSKEIIIFSIGILFCFVVFGIAFKLSTKICTSDRNYLCLPA